MGRGGDFGTLLSRRFRHSRYRRWRSAALILLPRELAALAFGGATNYMSHREECSTRRP